MKAARKIIAVTFLLIAYVGAFASGSFLDKLSINAGKFNNSHSFLSCPNTKGTVASARVRYSALSSVAMVWNIGWGVSNTLNGNRNGQANNINIVVILSNPVSNGKSANVLMNKVENNVPLSMLSFAEVVITFG